MQHIREYKIPLILFFVSVVILLQSPCAPFANKVAEYDAGVFIYSAKQMINGGLIYKEIFDHKGPVLYLINAAGLILFNGNLTGIWLMELISLFVTAIFLYKTAHLFADQFISSLATIYSLFVLASLEPGHGTQYYALPFISVSLYIFLKCFKQRTYFTKHQMITISFAFTLTLLLQPNLVTIWVAFGVVTILDLLIKKNYGRLFGTILLVIITITATLLPFIIYAIHYKLLSDAISCYWLFNRAYSHPSFGAIGKGAYYALINIEKGYAVIPLTFYLGYLALHFKKIDTKQVHAGIILSLFLTLFVGCGLSGLNYPHYSIILLPLICVVAAFCLEYLRQKFSLTGWLLLFIVVIFSWRLAVLQINNTYHAFKPDERLNALVEFIQRNTDKNDRIAVVGNDSQLYYLSGRKSSSRFHYTSPIFAVKGFDIDMVQQYLDDLHHNRPKLIVVKTADYPQQPVLIQNLLTENYELLPFEEAAAFFYLRKN